jgi:gluconate 2-dehydrogenase subunit 3-like protein
MKRRRFVQSLLTAPAAAPLVAQQAASPAPNAAEDNPKLELSVPDAAADPASRFFSAQQYAALQKLSELLMPAQNGAPGAVDARVPEFLDFLISESPAERQQVYRNGLDGLNVQAKKRFNRAFAEVEASQAEQLLAPLREAWTYDPPAEPVAHFLWTVRTDVRMATQNSREWSAAAAATGRRAGGVGLYWLPID